MESPDDTALCFATEDQIIDELKRRSVGLVLLRTRLDKDGDMCSVTDYRGGFVLAFGLIAEAHARFAKRAAVESRYSDPGEETEAEA